MNCWKHWETDYNMNINDKTNFCLIKISQMKDKKKIIQNIYESHINEKICIQMRLI